VRLISTALILIAGCGRIGFDPLGAPCTDPGCPDASAATIDATAGDGGADPDGGEGDGGADPDGGAAGETFAAVADTALNSAASGLNYGGGSFFNVRTSAISTFTGLVRFAPDAPPGAVVVAAQLWLTTTGAALGSGQVEVYRVLEQWVEGTQTGGAGVANHLERLAAVLWLSPGCGPGSRALSPAATFEPRETNTVYRVALPAALVQGWLDDPTSNHGLALVAADSGMDTVGFHSRESGADGPQLFIELAP
jgi:hypothetical protein